MSTHGYSQNQILVWKYPSLTQVAKLTGHSYRVLYLVSARPHLGPAAGEPLREAPTFLHGPKLVAREESPARWPRWQEATQTAW